MKKILLLLFFPLVILAQNQPKVGLVLSGGGAKGFAHIGVLKELEKAGVQIDYIGGTSMGAIVGGLYAAGYSANQIEDIILKTDFMKVIVDDIPRGEKPFFSKIHNEKYAIKLPIIGTKIGLPLGFSKGQNVLSFLTELLANVDEVKDFSKLPIPFYCIGTNIETGKEIALEKGFLPLALRASGAFPSLLNPVEIDNALLTDGGVVNNFPVDVMRKKGVDIVIGVSVHGELLKREELSSVASLLLQITNFQMHEKEKTQTDLLDIYIRPNVSEYGVISFDKKKEIIEEGKKTAKSFKSIFDSIAKLQPYKRKPYVLKLRKEKFLVDRIIIKGNENYTNNYILGKLQLREGDYVSYKDISKKINTLTDTNNFKRIDYHLEKSFKGKKLVLVIKEETINSYFNIGIHYDLLYDTGVLLNYNHKKILKQNDEFSLDVVVGDRVRYDFQYFIDNGLKPSYGISSRYNSFKSDVLFDDTIIDVRYTDFTNTLYFQTTFDKKIALGLGIEHKALTATSLRLLNNGDKTFFDDSNYMNMYSFLKLDTYNKEMFPTKGFYADVGFKWFVWSDRNKKLLKLETGSSPFNQFSQIEATLGGANTFFDKATIKYTSEFGYSFGEKPSEIFDYSLGGYNKNYINNFTSFYGYKTGALTNQSFLKLELDFKYKIIDKHYATFIANYARTEKDIISEIRRDILLEAYLFKNIKSGYAIGYSLESFMGPIELKYTWSPNHNEKYWLFNLGFWF